MLRKLLVSLSLVLLATAAAAPASMAQDKVEGTMDLIRNECYGVSHDANVFPWSGTVDVDGDVYDIVFWSVGGGLPPGLQTPETARAFNEVWAAYDGLEVAFDDECAVATFEGDLVLWGLNAGLSDLEASTYSATGIVMDGVGAFDGLAGAAMAMDGTITFTEEGAPASAPGMLEIG